MCNDYPITTLQVLSLIFYVQRIRRADAGTELLAAVSALQTPIPEKEPIDLGASFGRSENEAVLASCSRIEQQWSDKPHLAEQTGDNTGFCRVKAALQLS